MGEKLGRSGISRAEENRAIRRKALREQLEAQGHVQHVNVLLEKLSDLEQELDSVEVSRISKVVDAKLKIIAKYLPDDKEPANVNLGGQEDNPLVTEIKRIVIDAQNRNA